MMTRSDIQNGGRKRDRVVLFAGSHAGVRTAGFLASIKADVTAVVPEGSAFVSMLRKYGIEPVPAGDDVAILDSLDLPGATSIILPLEDESLNLRFALRAIEINPHIRVVIRLFNRNLARRLEETMARFTVLSVSQCAAPTFASAAFVDGLILSHQLPDAGRIVNVYRLTAGTDMKGTVEELEKSLGITFISVRGELLPEAGTAVWPGDSLVLFSDIETARRLQNRPAVSRVRESAQAPKSARSWKLVAPDPILTRILTALFLIAGFSVFYFSFFEKMRVIDSLYFVITVMTTVGFGDINLKDASDFSKIVGMLLMLSGVALFAILFAFVADSLMKKRLDYLLGRRKIKQRGHVIVCGMGDVGGRIVDVLGSLGENIVVVEQNPENRFLALLRDEGISYIIADATRGQVLDDAGVDHARAIICATDDDLKNVEIGMDVKAYNDRVRVVARIFDKEFADKVEGHLMLDSALSASSISAPLFAAAALDSGLIGRLEFGGRQLFFKQAELSAEGVPDACPDDSGKRKNLVALLADGTLCRCEGGLCPRGAVRIFYLGDTP